VAAPNESATLTRQSRYRHTSLGAAVVATAVTTYRVSASGLSVDVDVMWAIDVDVNSMCMMAAANGALASSGARFDRGQLLNKIGEPLTLSGGAGDVYLGSTKSAAAWVWESAGRVAVAMFAEDALADTNEWAKSGPIRFHRGPRRCSDEDLYRQAKWRICRASGRRRCVASERRISIRLVRVTRSGVRTVRRGHGDPGAACRVLGQLHRAKGGTLGVTSGEGKP
jgi:hypothetical protein